MDRAKRIVELAADQARDELSKEWLRVDERFRVIARQLIEAAPAWHLMVDEAVADRYFALRLVIYTTERQLARARTDLATAQEKLCEMLDDEPAEVFDLTAPNCMAEVTAVEEPATAPILVENGTEYSIRRRTNGVGSFSQDETTVRG